VLMALACTATPATPAPTPFPTPDVPFLDEETVSRLVLSYVLEYRGTTGKSHPCWPPINGGHTEQYVGNDIWVVQFGEEYCTFTVHDKEAHVILPK
jgi:hypothetical protein